MKGENLPALIGAPVGQLYVYREAGSAWQLIPSQIDEVTATGAYTTTEDGLLDANDEVVFMAGDAGDEATTPITQALAISPFWYKVEVSDPLSVEKGWAYIVRSTGAVPPSPDYVNYDPGSLQVQAINYVLGWATTQSGVDYMTLFGGPDILDRTKIRVRLHSGLTLTEDNPLFNPPPPVVLIRDGAVRVIVKRGPATLVGYASLLQNITPLSLPSSVTVDEARLSTDLSPAASGGTYYNENTPAGATIDGVADVIGTTPLIHSWRQVSLANGTIIQVADIDSAGGTPSHYYKDDSAVDSKDTGDQMSYGDSGVVVTLPTAKSFTIVTAQYILPGQQPNRGEEFYNNYNAALTFTAQLETSLGRKVYLPLVWR